MSTFDSLNDTFDIVPAEEAKPIKKTKPLIVSDKEDKEKDYQYARAMSMTSRRCRSPRLCYGGCSTE